MYRRPRKALYPDYEARFLDQEHTALSPDRAAPWGYLALYHYLAQYRRRMDALLIIFPIVQFQIIFITAPHPGGNI